MDSAIGGSAEAWPVKVSLRVGVVNEELFVAFDPSLTNRDNPELCTNLARKPVIDFTVDAAPEPRRHFQDSRRSCGGRRWSSSSWRFTSKRFLRELTTEPIL